MPVTKVTLFLNDGRGGWTESYYATSLSLTPLLAVPLALQLGKKRSAMLASGCVVGCDPCSSPGLTNIRISTLGAPRNTLFLSSNGALLGQGPASVLPNPSTAIVKFPLASVPPDVPWTGVGVILALANGHSSKRTFTGIPDAMSCDQGYLQEGPWWSVAQAFFNYLCGGSWGALTPQASPPGPAPVPIASWSQLTAGNPQFTVAAGDAFNALCGNKFVISGYKAYSGTPNLNGITSASPNTPGTATAVEWNLRQITKPIDPQCNGFVTPYVPTVTAFLLALSTQLTKKNRGRPTALLRGRSSPAKRR